MSQYLIQTVEVYRVETEAQAEHLINEAKTQDEYMLEKYKCEHKIKKSKGEIYDEYWRVTLVKDFNKETEPETLIEIKYEVK